MSIFYCPELAQCILDEVESTHATKVLRLKAGDSIQLIDGKGTWAEANITNAHHKHCGFQITKQLTQTKPTYSVHIAIAPTKNIERIEWFLEKCTEIGIDEISFIHCQHSERKQINEERLEKIVVSAMKQSKKAWLPKLNPLRPLQEIISTHREITQRFIAHLADENRVELKHSLVKGQSCVVLIGPEGDFTPEEIKHALDEGFQPVMLGSSRLRTETAGLIACHTIHLINT